MKKSSKQKIAYWGIIPQIEKRPSKNAKGMAFTNERRARKKGESIFYRAILSNQRTTDEARTLSVRGTLDILAFRNSVTKYNFKKFRTGLPMQKKGDYKKQALHIKKLSELIVN